MKEPRQSQTIIEELHDLNQLIADSKRLLQTHPSDKLLLLAVKQDEQRQKMLLKELHLSLSLYLYHAD